MFSKKLAQISSILIIIISCNNLTMLDVFKDENIPLEIEGVIYEIEFYKGGNITLMIKDSSKNLRRIAVGVNLEKNIKKGDYFKKLRNSNKCIIQRKDSIINLDCYEIPKKIRDSLGKIEEWSPAEKSGWQKLNDKSKGIISNGSK